jgi:glycosyltransferase involved in cell wall biosynthesis
MINPKVSIIIPIYKTELYLRECLLSVQRQTMADFEAILVNDCTPDGAMQIANEFSKADPRFSVVDLPTNRGPGHARNIGITSASGSYVNFLDSDDRLPIDAIEILLDLAETNQADMVIGNMAWITNNRLSPVKYIESRLRSWSVFRCDNLRMLSEEASLAGSICHHLVRTEIIKQNSISFPEGVLHEDVPFSMAVWFHSRKIISTLRYVYFRTRRYEPGNLSRTQTYNEKAFLDRDEIARHVFDFACQHTSSTESAARLGSITLLSMLGTTKNMLSSANEEIKVKITAGWFPLHSFRINNMVNHLNRLSTNKP